MEKQTSAGTVVPQLQKQAVLIIEDETTQRKLLEEHLKDLEYEVFSAKSGEEGLKVWQENEKIRIVITDLKMPKMDGLEVIRNIRETEKKYTYTMILSMADDKESILQGLALHVDDYVIKPVIKKELDLRLRGAMRLLRLEDNDKLVVALSELVATRGGEPDVHLKRVKAFTRIIGQDLYVNHPELGLTEQMIEDIANISVLHDIGKISIPDGLLTKRGQYSKQEFEIIKAHSTCGANLLHSLYEETASTFLLIGYDIVLSHHERWDGEGYPAGLKREEIPLPARIVSFTDAFDATISRRPYKDPLPVDSAIKVVSEQGGVKFDPMIIESFHRCLDAFQEVIRKYPEPPAEW